MTPLDLTQGPPRSPREELRGLCMLPRMIDIARAKLPGGNVGEYQIGQGMSAIVLAALGLGAAQFVELVRSASSDADVAAALWQGAAAPLKAINARLSRATVAHVPPDLRTTFQQLYGTELPSDSRIFDVIEADDRNMFPKLSDARGESGRASAT